MQASHNGESSAQNKIGGPSLYLVATPIGNLEDITLRALRVLKEVDLIACEDTRQTLKLLSHYGIQTRLVSYHEHNEMTKASELVVDLEGGAFLAALVASGLPTDSFRFSGFLPAKLGPRRKLLESVKDSPRTQVFYEAPHRLLETLADVVELLGNDRHVVVAREVTKLHEEFLRGRAREILGQFKARGDVKGEITLLIAKAEEGAAPSATESVSVAQRVREIMAKEKADEKSALKKVAKERGIGKSEAYREWQRGK